MSIEKDDLIVVPEDLEVDPEVVAPVYKMKYVLRPSIIRSFTGSKGIFDMSIAGLLKSLVAKKFPFPTKTEVVEEWGQPFYRYIRPRKYMTGELTPSTGVTLLIYPSLSDPSTYKFSYSICSPKDAFNKKIAREITLGRAKTDRYFIIKNVRDSKTIVHHIYMSLLDVKVNDYNILNPEEIDDESSYLSKVPPMTQFSINRVVNRFSAAMSTN